MAKKVVKRKRFAPKSLVELFSSKRRWMQRRMGDGHGRYCLLGGAVHVYRTDEALQNSIRKICTKLPAWSEGSIATFNDASTTTFADIQRVVRKARV